MPAGSGRWTDADLACGGARVRDARDLVPVPQATVGAADEIVTAFKKAQV
ncbi:hypothetical protein [Streptomyces botrytidirepellens]|nr:hypothetical protein [Streptomyces botrytidirepellens]